MSDESLHTLVVGISSRALFDLEKENRIFEEDGLSAYSEYQRDNEEVLLEPGTGFPLICALLNLNRKIGEPLVEVIIMSRNDPQTGLRIMHSVDFYSLDITRTAFSGGAPLGDKLKAFNIDLYLSKNERDVQDAAEYGVASALLYNPPESFNPDTDEIRIAFDGDAVIFSEDSELIFRQQGLEAFRDNETMRANDPLPEGPFGRILKTFSHIKERSVEPLVRIALVTARDRITHERVILTLRNWGVNVDEAYFLGGISKEHVLKTFNAHIFFDDQDIHVKSASEHVPSARVPYKKSSGLYEDESVEQD